MHFFTKKEIAWLKKNYSKFYNKELTKRFNLKFKTDCTISSIAGKCKILNLKKDEKHQGQFREGHIPANKGLKWQDYMSDQAIKNSRQSTFKIGHKPLNSREIFSERITKDGYIEIKVKEPNVWILKQRYVYEQANGPIPKGYKILFADGNKLNCELDNLLLVSAGELLLMNVNGLCYKDKEATKCGLTIAKILEAKGKVKKK